MSEPRSIPINGSSDNVSKPLVTTTGKVITWLVVLVTAIVTVEGWLLSNRFESIIDKRFSQFELQLTREYAPKAEAVTKLEYELRHREVTEAEKAMNDRVTAIEQRIQRLEATHLGTAR